MPVQVKNNSRQTPQPEPGLAPPSDIDGVPPPTAETRSAGVSPPSSVSGVPPASAETRRIQKICDDIISFRQSHEGRLPNRGANAPADEKRLGNHRYKLRMRCTKALGDEPSGRMLNAEEIALFERAVAEAMPESQSEQPPSKNNTISGAMPSTGGAPPLTHDTSSASDPKAQLNSLPPQDGTGGARSSKILTQAPKKQTKKRVDPTSFVASGAEPPIEKATGADTADTNTKRRKSTQKNQDQASGSKALTVKRKSDASTSTVSGTTQRAQRPRTGEASETIQTNMATLTAEDWAELHEFKAWLETPEAARFRKDHILTDKQSVEHLLVYPPSRATMEPAGSILGIKRDRRTLTSWHHGCVREATQRFRTWLQGGVANMLKKGPKPADIHTMDDPLKVVETVNEMREKRDYWWTTILTRSFRHCRTLRMEHPQLLTEDAW